MAKKIIEKEYSIKTDQLYMLAVDAIMKLQYAVMQQSKVDGFINFKTGMTLTSWSGLSIGAIISESSVGSKISFGGCATDASKQVFVIGGAKPVADKVTKLIDVRIKKGDIPPHNPTPTGGQAFSVSVADEIRKLAELKDQNILTQAEFDAKKKQLLGI